MKILRYITFGLVILNIPSTALSAYGSAVGALLSYTSIGLLALYYFLEQKTTPNWWLIIISILFFMIGGLQFKGLTFPFIMEIIKYFIYLICAYELAKHISTSEYNIFLLLGSTSIILEALLFTSKFGRYSGFYMAPNEAGFICILGYATTYGLKNKNIKLLGQFIFTLAGLLTFSRTFIVIWLLLNVISLKISIKNIRIFGLGFLIISTLFFIDEVVGLNNPRFEQLKSIVNNDGDVSSEEINDDSRADTWAMFYDDILDSPLIGNGYGSFTGKLGSLGAHNTFLAVLGEAGILPFILFMIYIGYLIVMSIIYFNKKPNLIMQMIGLSLFLMANHNFFTFYYVSFAAIWIQYQIYQLRNDDNEIEVLNKKFS
ncbi:O-antigen ligase family protein [Winogradskyella psychrotolerans]|uniref:O-antigen ligase family protein n=1 Tax=Winogradskyella psychrotolerans TaxID=1344585 RepID=UPI001C075180|nr:O-antigen ligase family protein [Winogradskyella psychrotolerans]MBU2928367.1 O-antigen ligase family protein [Winogradskyella psychrotolerans]